MGVIEDKGQKAIKYAKELLELYKYGTPLTYGDDENEMIKILLMIIEGKDCVIETQAHNEEVLMEYFNRNTCLHCGKGKPAYCEDCYQDLIGTNAKLQEEKANDLEVKIGELSINMKVYDELKRNRKVVHSIDKDFFFDFVDGLIEINNELGKERDGIYEDYQDLGKEKLKLEEELDKLKPECTDKEWQHCRVEKRGCEGCHYDKKEGKNEVL